jgi:hypothetical protein
MKRTPEAISRARQAISRDMAEVRAGIAAARAGSGPAEIRKKIAYGEKLLTECRKRMAKLRGKGRKPWTFKGM